MRTGRCPNNQFTPTTTASNAPDKRTCMSIYPGAKKRPKCSEGLGRGLAEFMGSEVGVDIHGRDVAGWQQGALITTATAILMGLSPHPSLLCYPNTGVLNHLP